MRQVKTLGLLGTGVIGGGWAARALHFGIDVVAADLKPEMQEWIRGAVANAEGALARLTLAPLPPKGKLSFTTDLHAMARQADFIQENIPEQLELKQRVLADVSHHAPADVVIASSTSGLMPSDLQRGMVAPERFLVAHPFNPVYLLPLVELVGGEPGMRHMLRQFGPCLKWPWTKLEAPELTEALIDKMVAGTQAQAGGRSIRELERLRDDYLVAIQQVLKPYNIGAGATLRALEERLYETAAAGARARITDADQPLRLVETYVRPEWIDYNGHMTDSRYLQVFGDATDALFRYAGVDDAYRRSGRAMYTVETHVSHQAEARALEPLYVTTRVLEVDDKRVRLFHSLHRRRDEALVATAEQLYLHVNTPPGKASPMDAAVRAQLADLQSAHRRGHAQDRGS